MDDPNDPPVIVPTIELENGEREPGQPTKGALIDVIRFKQEYLFGVPLKAALTGEEMSDDTIKQFIRKGIAEFEKRVRIPVSPCRIKEKFNYERADDMQFGFKRLSRWPVMKVEEFSALWPGRTEGGEVPYPTNWVEVDGQTGNIQIVPKAGTDIAYESYQHSYGGYQGIIMGKMKTWPNMWRITYLAGFANDQVPDAVNDLIGVMAARKFLSQMGPAIFPMNSYSIGFDGMSQGTGNAGPQWLAQRMQELEAQEEQMVRDLKSYYGTDIIMSVW